MLETKIETLTKAVADLNVNIETLNMNLENLFANRTTAPAKDLSENAYAKAKAKVAEPDPVEDDAPAEKPAPKKRDAKKAEPVEEPTKDDAPVEEPTEETVSTDDLQRFVLNLVREKRHLRDKIKDLVQEITGAKFMHDVPVNKAGDLKAAIEKLASEE